MFLEFSESLRRRELAEMETMKSREALRCEAEKRRIETEAELTRILVPTHRSNGEVAREGWPNFLWRCVSV
ncbi:hypothetical protein Dsin_011804 [Dipteronia sinensis]|uniref:Uncharacterized protein n=1 Tax=Dipteronia sinensis TaxID=43782 RepID=A0AAE0AI45_9ROSI|nr:hypothetical protein Dsin_011804 [Dipteronia sinensis]